MPIFHRLIAFVLDIVLVFGLRIGASHRVFAFDDITVIFTTARKGLLTERLRIHLSRRPTLNRQKQQQGDNGGHKPGLSSKIPATV